MIARHVPRRGVPHARALVAALLLVASLRDGRAADPQPYTVTIAATGQADVDKAAHDTSTLVSLRENGPVGPFALVARARDDAGRMATVLNSFGYYSGHVAVTVDGKPPDDPGLTDALAAVPTGTPVAVDVTLTLGPLFHLGVITLSGDFPADSREKLGLAEGAPARAADVLAARDRLLASLTSTGHALAKVDAPVATLHTDTQTLDVAFQGSAGPRVDLGPITISGLDRVNESFVRRRLLLHDGEQYDPAKIEAARQDLASEGVFSSVRMTAADRLAPNGTLPLEVAVTERPRHVVNFNASFSTDLGGTLGASWVDRDLFGNAEQLTLSAAATELGGSAAKQPGYNVSATLAFPDWLVRDQTLTLNTTALKEYLEAYDRTAYLASVTVARKISPNLTLNVGLSGEQAKITQESVTRDYTLAQIPLGAVYDSTGSLFDPIHGYKLSATVTPTESIQKPSGTFVIAQVTAATYINLEAPGRGVLALRALVGGVEGATTFQIPPDQRFYAGGSGTVRGYKYQSVGPRFADNNPVGGTSIDAVNVEFRQRFGESYGAVVFADAGQVGTGGTPFSGQVRVGAGLGARYYTALGPIRLDIAVPLNKRKGDDALEAYIGLGQAF